MLTAAGVSAVNIDSAVQPDVKTDVDPILDPIPEPPPIPQDIIDETVNQLNALGEPTLESLGLGGYSPVGLAQKAFEFLHVSVGLEWWAAIAVGECIISEEILRCHFQSHQVTLINCCCFWNDLILHNL